MMHAKMNIGIYVKYPFLCLTLTKMKVSRRWAVKPFYCRFMKMRWTVLEVTCANTDGQRS